MRVLIAAALLAVSLAHAKEYGSYDLKRVLLVSQAPDGKKKFAFDLAYLDRMLADLGSHARNYPPSFDSPQDRSRAEKDVKALSSMLDLVAKGPKPGPDMLLRAAFLNAIGHNLDLPGAGEKASSLYERLLSESPDHPRGNHHYGTFLAGTGKFQQSIPRLEKALAGGVAEAEYALGMVYVSLGNKGKALSYLESYRARAPNTPGLAKLIDAVRSGKVEALGVPRQP